jgi:hypothetical protein
MKLLTTSQRNSLIIALALICGILFTKTILDAGQQTIYREKTTIATDNLDFKTTVKRVNRNKNNAMTIEGKTQVLGELNNLKDINQILVTKKVRDWDSMQMNIAILILITMFIVTLTALRCCRKK